MKENKKFIESFTKCSKSERQEKLDSLKAEEISQIVIQESKSEFSLILWTSICEIEDEKKLYKISKEVLPKLNRDELSLRQYQDFITRFLIQLPSKTLRIIYKISLLCASSLAIGDQRAPFYKDILPLCLKFLQKGGSKTLETQDGNVITAKEASATIINGILKENFAISTLTTLVSMFKDIEISTAQQDMLITKVCEHFDKVNHNDIGNLALVTFQQASYNQIIIPLLALDKYFYKRRYRFILNEYESATDDIEETSGEGLFQAEETTIYHFQNTAEFTTIERNITTALKAIEYTPNFILSPFLSTILVSIAKISSSVQGNFRLNQSTILPFMKQVFKLNEEHRQILSASGWAKSIDPVDAVNTDSLLRMLKENTCALKSDVALNGLFGLSFLLLKTKASPALNKFSIDFLNDIIKNRSEFTSDIMFIIVKMLYTEKNKAPIVECFSSIVSNRYLDIAASEPALQKLIEDLTELDLDTALAIESVIFTAISKSIHLRDIMIENMTKAMYSRNVEIRKMAIFSFCIMLRKFTKPSQRASGSNTQSRFSHNISMFSLTQSQIAISVNSNRSNIRQVEIIMLEILGLLRKCFSENSEIKLMMYESLLNAIQANSFIISNVFEFLDGHFRMYFDCDNEEMLMDFNKLFKQSSEANDADPIIIMDDLGQLLKFMISCIVMTKEYHQRLNCDLKIYEDILSKLIEKSCNATMEQLQVFSSGDSKNSIIAAQFLNCFEALMLYCYYQMTRNNDAEYKKKLLLLFEKYQDIKKDSKKMRAAKSDIKSIWNLKECAAFLKTIFSDDDDNDNELKQNKEFSQYVLITTSQKLAELETTTEHSKAKYSRTIYEAFLSCSALFYQQLHTDNFAELHDNYSKDCAASLTDAFKKVLCAMETTYGGKKEKFNQLLRAMLQKNNSSHDNHQNQDDYCDSLLLEIIQRIHRTVEWVFEQEKKNAATDFASSSVVILSNLFATLQILYGKFNAATMSRECFNWILHFAKKTIVKQKQLATLIIKLLIQCINQHENAILIECVSHKISSCYQYRRTLTEPECASQNNFAIITKQTSVDEAFSEFIDFIKQTLIVVEFYINRSNSFNAHAQLRGQESHNDTCTALQALETAICTKVIAMGKAIERIASSKFPISTRNIEKIVGVVKLYYNCLINLMKHFRKHHNIKSIDCETIGLEDLIKFSRKFAACVYSIAPYIEKAAEEEFAKGGGDAKARAKKRDAILNKETKTIPRMIFLIETFNTQVASFDGASKSSLSKYLHPGEVRDFHIGNKLLKDAIVRSQTSARSQILENDDDDSDNENVQPNNSTKRKRRLSSTSDSDNDNVEEDESKSNATEDESQPSPPPTRSIRVRLEKNKRALKGDGKKEKAATSKNLRKKK